MHEVQTKVGFQPSLILDRLCSRGARCIACLTLIIRPPTEKPFFTSIARFASSVTALQNYK